ncbi:MAG: DUF6449 domain-containing protein [Clostridium sp.]|nr:DUF6449 domain-containing protein [Clostridium sp.]
MTSKNSFLVSMKENSKRRLWVWMLSALFFVLALPVTVSITLSQKENTLKYLIDVYGEALAQEALHERLVNNMCGQLGFAGGIFIFVIIVAIASGIQGFSYLYNRKKIDFYMGMPVKRKKRFLIIWLNGIILYVIPYLLGLIISLLIAAGNGAVDGRVLLSAAAAFGVNLLFYLCIYHMAILALMLTGNMVITGLGFLVFCLYEYVVRETLNSYKAMFFRYFNYYGADAAPVLSPFIWYEKIQSTFNYKNTMEAGYIMALAAFALVIGVLAYVCYLKRPAEAAGKAMTFNVTKPVIKVLLTVPMALLAGLLIADSVNYTPRVSQEGIGYMVFTIAVVLVLGNGLIQAIYEFDVKGFLHAKSHILISGVFTALIFLIFRYDLTGYDSYIPKPEQIESFVFLPSYYEEAFGSGARFDENGEYLSDEAYGEKYMFLGQKEEICQLADISIKAYNQLFDKYHDSSEWNVEETGRWADALLVYRLKNGREVRRQIWVNVEDEATALLLDKIIGSEKFKTGYFPGASENLMALLENNGSYKINASYGNMVYWEDMSKKEMMEFLKIYQEDLKRANFSNVKASLPVGVGRISIMEELPDNASYYSRSTRSWYVGMNIYPFYEDCIAWLKEHGYYMDSQLKIEDVEHIQVINNNTEIYNKLAEEQKMTAGSAPLGENYTAAKAVDYAYYGGMDYGEDTIDTRVYVDYSEGPELEKIGECIYPQDMLQSNWDCGISREEDYTVYVYFKADSPMTKKYGSAVGYAFPEGQVPEFVEKDTLYP